MRVFYDIKNFKLFESDTVDFSQIDKETKEKIENMSHQELASLWRFGKSENPLLQGLAGKYVKHRLFDHFGGFNPSLSKNLGW